MTIHILGYGPITEHLFIFLVAKSEAYIYSERDFHFHDTKTRSYEAFLNQTINQDDVVIMAWREIPIFDSKKGEVLRFLKDKLQSSNIVLYLSSVSVYGQKSILCTEKTTSNPLNSYGRAKYALENYLQDNLNSNLIIARISNVFGDKNFNDVVNRIINSLDNGETLSLSSPAVIERDLISIVTVVRCIERLLKSDHSTKEPQVFNISSGESITLEKLHALIEEEMEMKIPYIKLPASLDTIILSRVSNSKFVETYSHPIDNQIEHLKRFIGENRVH